MRQMGEYYPGEEYGLPPAGAGSVASYGARILAVVVDGTVLGLAAQLYEDNGTVGGFVVAVLLVLVVMPVRWGSTLGQAALRLRVVPVVDGRALLEQRGLNVWTALGRAQMWLCFPVFFLIALVTGDRDHRTAFDRWTRTMIVER